MLASAANSRAGSLCRCCSPACERIADKPANLRRMTPRCGNALTPWACAVLVAASMLTGCSADPSRQANLAHCLADDRDCDASLLTDEQRQQIDERQSARHFEDCLAGLRCNELTLSEEQRRQVRDAVAQINLQACLKGEAGCTRSSLTGTQLAAVEENDAARNLVRCMSGLTGCDESRLTDTERRAMREAYTQRNFSGCMNTVGTLVRCSPEDLSDAQRELVERRNRAANLYVCANALLGCDERLLTDDQRKLLQANKLSAP